MGEAVLGRRDDKNKSDSMILCKTLRIGIVTEQFILAPSSGSELIHIA